MAEEQQQKPETQPNPAASPAADTLSEDKSEPEQQEPENSTEYSYSDYSEDVDEPNLQMMRQINRRKRDAFTILREQQNLEKKLAYLEQKKQLQQGKQRLIERQQTAQQSRTREIQRERQDLRAKLQSNRKSCVVAVKPQDFYNGAKTTQELEKHLAEQKADVVRRQREESQRAREQHQREERARVERLREEAQKNRIGCSKQKQRRHKYELQKMRQIRQVNEEEVLFLERQSQMASKTIDEMRRQEELLLYELHEREKQQKAGGSPEDTVEKQAELSYPGDSDAKPASADTPACEYNTAEPAQCESSADLKQAIAGALVAEGPENLKTQAQ